LSSNPTSPFSPEAFVARDRLGAVVGARFVSLEPAERPTECRYEYDAVEAHHNPGGILHGGALFTVMDSSQGMLTHAVLAGSGEIAATGTATIKYLAPVWSGRIQVRTILERREGRKLHVRSEATDQAGKLVATVHEVWIVLAPRPA